MASTIQAPPPAPPAPPRRRRQRSFAGPVVLILLGVCFLLSNMGVISWHDFGHWFSRYWPALLIVWGIIKLIEYQRADRTGERPAGIGAGGVMLIVLLVIAGLASTEVSRWNFGDMCRDSDFEGVPWCGHAYNYDDQLQQAFPAGGALHVASESGAINVTSSDDNQIHVAVHKRIKAERQEQADKWN